MPRDIRIDFDFGDEQPDIHRVRNFGEELFSMMREKGTIICSLDEIDRATDVIFATIRSARRSRRVIAEITALLGKHYFSETAQITILPRPS